MLAWMIEGKSTGNLLRTPAQFQMLTDIEVGKWIFE
jgi:hypothetical protein